MQPHRSATQRNLTVKEHHLAEFSITLKMCFGKYFPPCLVQHSTTTLSSFLLKRKIEQPGAYGTSVTVKVFPVIRLPPQLSDPISHSPSESLLATETSVSIPLCGIHRGANAPHHQLSFLESSNVTHLRALPKHAPPQLDQIFSSQRTKIQREPLLGAPRRSTPTAVDHTSSPNADIQP